MQHGILHWPLRSCLFIHKHESRKIGHAVLSEAKGTGSFNVNMIMKVYSDHNYSVNDDDLDADDDKD